jgi:membrane-bound lytic murein transglycosylase MltF
LDNAQIITIADNCRKKEKRAQEVIPVTDPGDRLHMQRMYREQNRRYRRYRQVSGKKINQPKHQETIKQMQNDIC